MFDDIDSPSSLCPVKEIFLEELQCSSINEPSLDQQIANMLILGFHSDATEEICKQIENHMLGGVILFKHNIESPNQLKFLTNKLRLANPDIFIAVDQEGGRVQRLTPELGFKNFPSAVEISANYNLVKAKELYSDLAKELKEYDINTNFGPVVDLNNPNCPCPVIGGKDRSYSDDPAIISSYATCFIDAHREHNILTAIKHFPGHGYANSDSHLGMTDVTETFNEKELIPFYDLIENNKVDMIMTAHIVNRNYDEHPATLSSVTLKKLLRDKGYNGVIISDDLNMGAILSHYDFEESIIRAINAGCDLIIFSNNPLACKNVTDFSPDHDLPSKFIQVIKQAIIDGKIDIELIKKSYERITLLKNRFLA